MKVYMQKPSRRLALLAVVLIGFMLMNRGLKGDDFKNETVFELKPDIKQELAANRTPAILSDQPGATQNVSMPLYGQWKSYTTADGLPSNKINNVKIDDERVLVGTDKGMAVYENDEWKVYTPEEGLAHRNVLSIDVDEASGDVWIATMGGLNRWSAGAFERFDQFNSGLANDVVYEVVCDGRYIWAATAAGASRYDTYTRQWKIFNEKTSPMNEPWTYGITIGENKTYIAAWAGGIIEYNNETGNFRVYRDPDGQKQLVMTPDDGLVHDVVSSVSFDDGTLWVATYFGMSRYNGQRWWGYFEHDSGLSSDFINAVKAKKSIVYVSTDNGLNTFDGTTWITYNTVDGSAKGEITITRGESIEKIITDSSLSHRYIWSMDIKDDTIWVATSKGLSTAKIIGSVEDYI